MVGETGNHSDEMERRAIRKMLKGFGNLEEGAYVGKICRETGLPEATVHRRLICMGDELVNWKDLGPITKYSLFSLLSPKEQRAVLAGTSKWRRGYDASGGIRMGG